MDCQKCGCRPATVFLTTVVGNDLKRTDLCGECAQEAGAVPVAGFLPVESLPATSPRSTADESDRCPACGFSSGSFHKTGKLGCAVCYERFSSLLQAVLQESQKGVLHIGKRPSRRSASPKDLESELSQLIRTEQYEEAAKIRDRIAGLKAPLGPRKSR